MINCKDIGFRKLKNRVCGKNSFPLDFKYFLLKIDLNTYEVQPPVLQQSCLESQV